MIALWNGWSREGLLTRKAMRQKSGWGKVTLWTSQCVGTLWIPSVPKSVARLEHAEILFTRVRPGHKFPAIVLGKNWATCFITRHHDKLGMYWSSTMDRFRSRAVNPIHQGWTFERMYRGRWMERSEMMHWRLNGPKVWKLESWEKPSKMWATKAVTDQAKSTSHGESNC